MMNFSFIIFIIINVSLDADLLIVIFFKINMKYLLKENTYKEKKCNTLSYVFNFVSLFFIISNFERTHVFFSYNCDYFFNIQNFIDNYIVTL